MKDELTEIKEKVRKYIVRRIKKSQDKTDFLIKDFSSNLRIDKNIVQETLKSFEAEKSIYIIHDWDKNKYWGRFKITILDEKWFERK